jgi:TRAP-type C4-dicarboxylate transport system substrate-binding protein
MSGYRSHIFAAAVAGSFACASPLHATDWDFAIAYPLNNFQTLAAQRFASEVGSATSGRVKITVHPGGALGFKGPDMLGAIRDGLVPTGSFLFNQQVGLAPILGIASLPYLVSGLDEMKKFNDAAKPVYAKEFAKFNQKLLYIVPWPGQNIFSKAEITGPESFKVMKIRTVDRNGSEFFRDLGASPSQMPWGDVVPALATGVIDSVTTSTSSAVDGQFWEFMKDCTVVNWQSSFDAVTVNVDAWQKLSPEDQKAVESVAQRLEPEFWSASKAEDVKNFELLKSKGLKIVDAPPSVRNFMISKGKPTWSTFTKDHPDVKPLVEAYLAAVGK